MPYKDPKRQKEAQRFWYEKHKSEVYARCLKKRNLAKRFIDQYKLDHPICKDCGISYPPHILDFDHLSNKIAGLSKMGRDGIIIKRIEEEIKKCEVVCFNCHRHRTWLRRLNKADVV